MGLRDLLRRVKRRVVYGGYAWHVHAYLRALKSVKRPFGSGTGIHAVNLSFDTEIGFCMAFWRKEPESVVVGLGQKARATLTPFIGYLGTERIPCSVQIVAALLDRDLSTVDRFFDAGQRGLVARHRDLFRLTDDEVALLRSPLVEIGIHGLSHRPIATMGLEDARYEIVEAARLVEARFGKKPRWMSFPKNGVAHLEALAENGIGWWRGCEAASGRAGEIPEGLFYSTAVLNPSELRRVLRTLKKRYPDGFLLQLWGHFTEMPLEELKAGVEAIRAEGWTFAAVPEDYVHA